MKKRMFSLLLAALMLLAAIPSSAAAVVDTTYTIIEPQYADVAHMYDGYAAVKIDGKWGYIDTTGKMAVEPRYDWAGRADGGIALVAKHLTKAADGVESDGYYAYLVNLTTGAETALAYDEWRLESKVAISSPTLDPFKNASNYGGIVTVGGHPFRADGSEIVAQGFAELKYYDHATGESRLTYEDNYTHRVPVDGILTMTPSAVWYGMPMFYHMDAEGKILRTFRNAQEENWEDVEKGIEREYAKGFIDVCAPNGELTMVKYGGRDKTGKEVIGYWGVVDAAGNFVIPAEYTNFIWRAGRYVNSGLITLCDQAGKWGACDTAGNVIIPFIYDDLGAFVDGYTLATLGSEKFYLDKHNNRLAVSGVAEIKDGGNFGDTGYAVFEDETGRRYLTKNLPEAGVLPQLTLPAGYDLVGLNGDWAVIAQDGKYGYAQIHENRPASGTPIGDVKYTKIVAYIDGKPIRSFNINDNTHIVVEDLAQFGFSVTWVAEGSGKLIVSGERTATPDAYTTTYAPDPTAPTTGVAMSYLSTDVTAWLGDMQVTGYNIGGMTCIWLDDLYRIFGYGLVWDGTEGALRLTTQP